MDTRYDNYQQNRRIHHRLDAVGVDETGPRPASAGDSRMALPFLHRWRGRTSRRGSLSSVRASVSRCFCPPEEASRARRPA
ncbi:MAG: hypothetical protein H6667_05265 [Ardenticatenaceae bacterium]|nr:hypothetical protein [Ardenticatenaceae bacterium]